MALKRRIEELERRIAELEARRPVEYHYHYHLPVPQYYQLPPAQIYPWWGTATLNTAPNSHCLYLQNQGPFHA
jgi:hypothetical protein